jgi:hypothetical protein
MSKRRARKLAKKLVADRKITLYRGLEREFDKSHDISSTDAPHGYSTWTDNIKLAREYAGQNGFIYKIELPESSMGDSFIDEDGERPLFFDNDKGAGLNGVSGKEYLVYQDHEDFSFDMIKLVED